MPYILSPLISSNSPGMWAEGLAYEKKTIYSIEAGKMPPVNYDEHTLRSHSLTHLETPAHTKKDGNTLDFYYREKCDFFFGRTLVLKLKGNNYKKINENIYHWIIDVEEITERLKVLNLSSIPNKILITTEFYPINDQGYHDPNYVLTLSQDAANFLVSHKGFNLYGTSWKSSDYNPGASGRPIHDTLFSKGLILENLKLDEVEEGTYFMTAFPIPLQNASESPVVPVLFSKEEIIENL